MSLLLLARQLAKLLHRQQTKIVFAESCTAGLCSASLAKVPGISALHCGGMVVYRNETKTAYLDISPRTLQRYGAVSEQVAKLMAEKVLKKTPEANLALSVTGHLGPHAPEGFDGVAYIGLSTRNKPTKVHRYSCPANSSRGQRQRLVTAVGLQYAADYLASLASKSAE